MRSVSCLRMPRSGLDITRTIGGGRLNGRFEIGVTIFFVLSAFLLTGRWLGSPDDVPANRPDLRKYFTSRAKRVLPAYWIVVTAAFLIHAADDPPPSGGGLQGWLRSMSFTQTLQFGWIHPCLLYTSDAADDCCRV